VPAGITVMSAVLEAKGVVMTLAVALVRVLAAPAAKVTALVAL
jgi:hypothetical protein